MAAITHKRIQHAAHYEGPHPAKGHDLEQWDYLPDGQTTRDRCGDPVRPDGIPSGAEYHCGYLDREGRQHWLFVRRVPLTGPACNRCPR